MASQAEVRWSQLRIGVIVLVSLLLLTVLLFLMTSATGVGAFSKKLRADVYFQNSQGLKQGAPVTLEGVTIGEVDRVTVVDDEAHKLNPVHVNMKLNPKFRAMLHTDTKAALTTSGVIGDPSLELNSQTAHGPEFPDGGTFQTMEVPSIATFVKESQGTVEKLNVTVAKLNSVIDGMQKGEGTVGQLLKNPSLYNEANATLVQLHTLSVNLNQGRGSVGRLLHDDDLYNKLDDAATHLDALTKDLSSGKGTVGKLLTDQTAYDNLNGSLKHMNSLLAQIDSGQGSVGELIKDPAMAHNLNQTVTQLNTLLTGVNGGKGTLGKLATDDSAYVNLNKLLTESTTLVTMLRQDPKKYLTIHMKVF